MLHDAKRGVQSVPVRSAWVVRLDTLLCLVVCRDEVVPACVFAGVQLSSLLLAFSCLSQGKHAVTGTRPATQTAAIDLYRDDVGLSGQG